MDCMEERKVNINRISWNIIMAVYIDWSSRCMCDSE